MCKEWDHGVKQGTAFCGSAGDLKYKTLPLQRPGSLNDGSGPSHIPCAGLGGRPSNNPPLPFLSPAGAKALVCDQCGAQFSKEDALETHRQTHTGTWPSLFVLHLGVSLIFRLPL